MTDEEIITEDVSGMEMMESGNFTVAGELIVSEPDDIIEDDPVIAKPVITPEIKIIRKHQRIEDQIVKDLMEHKL
jgi:hypothetical protein